MTEGGRVAAVTGAASGIGRATALALSRPGARVALCDRNTEGLAEVAKTIDGAGGGTPTAAGGAPAKAP